MDHGIRMAWGIVYFVLAMGQLQATHFETAIEKFAATTHSGIIYWFNIGDAMIKK